MRVVVLGNPGVGKSTILNSIIRLKHFPSGPSLATGLTTQKQLFAKGSVEYVDTPGLEDVHMMKRAAKEISDTFNGGGEFKLIFVCRLIEGRVHPGDCRAIKAVVSAVEEVVRDKTIGYSVIVNKVTSAEMEELETKEIHDRIADSYGMKRGRPKLLFVPLKEEAVGARNIFVGDETNYEGFVNSTPALILPPSATVRIDLCHLAAPAGGIHHEVVSLRSELQAERSIESRNQNLIKGLWSFCSQMRGKLFSEQT